jgi:hypothetical protein
MDATALDRQRSGMERVDIQEAREQRRVHGDLRCETARVCGHLRRASALYRRPTQ